MNEVIKAMKERRSVRKFSSKVPEKELIDQVIEAGIYAASGRGKQSPIVVAITNKEFLKKLSEDNCKIGGWEKGFDPFYGAPVVLLVLADKSCATAVYDGSLVMGNLMLAAHSLGLGSCWIHRAREEFETPEYQSFLKDLGVEGDYIGIGHCALGYSDEPAKPAPERKANRVFYFN
ncbi:MAG: nitroreductase [Thermoguttaceae bacterium]|jgi:nitroreductase